MISPTHQLPHEIISHIFLLGHRGCPLHDRAATIFLLSVTAVCALWRDVAISSSALWTSIYYDGTSIGSGEDRTREAEKVVARVEAFLSRSRYASLDIFVSCEISKLKLGIAVVDLIRPHLQRCRSFQAACVEFSGDDHSPLRRLLPLPGPLPRLTNLQITMSVPSHPPVLLVEPCNASPLTTLHLLGRGTVDASNIRTTTITDLLVNVAIRLTDVWWGWRVRERNSNSLTSLVSCDFYGHGGEPLPPAHLPNLKRLATSLSSLKQVPEAMACEGIEELIIYRPSYHHHSVFPIDPIPPNLLLWRNLRTLKIDCLINHLEEYIILLAALPTVTTITCFEKEGRDIGVHIIRYLGTRPALVPKLEVLQLQSPPPQVIPRLSALDSLDTLWSVRPALRLECARGVCR